MSEDPSPVIKIYRESAATMRELVKKFTDKNLIKYANDDIDRLELHAKRLENDHAECITPCCPVCTMKGEKKSDSS